MISKGVEIRATIDNRTTVALQTASGGGVLVAINTLPALIDRVPTELPVVSIFVFCNSMAFLASLVGNIARRRTSRLFENSWNANNRANNSAEDQQKSSSLALRAERFSWVDWGLQWLSIVLLAVGYLALACLLWRLPQTLEVGQ